MTACVFCGGTIPRALSLEFIFSAAAIKDPIICTKCFEKFEAIPPPKACPGCGRLQQSVDVCSDCEKWKVLYPNITPKHQALYTYNDMAHDYMQQFKFQGDILLAEIFKKKLQKALNPYKKTHLIVPIPASKDSLKTRGFNQVELLLKQAQIPYKNLLRHKNPHSEKQSNKNRFDRLKISQPFRLAKDIQTLKKPVFIVDDVYTTGRTIFHARELFELLTSTASFSLFR